MGSEKKGVVISDWRQGHRCGRCNASVPQYEVDSYDDGACYCCGVSLYGLGGTPPQTVTYRLIRTEPWWKFWVPAKVQYWKEYEESENAVDD